MKIKKLSEHKTQTAHLRQLIAKLEDNVNAQVELFWENAAFFPVLLTSKTPLTPLYRQKTPLTPLFFRLNAVNAFLLTENAVNAAIFPVNNSFCG